MEVHREYGFGISEGVYEEALCIELEDYGTRRKHSATFPCTIKVSCWRSVFVWI